MWADQERLRSGDLTEAQIRIAAEFLLDPEIEQTGGGRRLDAAHRHQIFEVVGAQAGSVDLMNAGVKSSAGPAHKVFEIGIDDGPGTSLVAQSLLHAAR